MEYTLTTCPAFWDHLRKGNPKSPLVNRQKELAKEILHAEFLAFKPTAVVLVSGDDYSDLVEDVFGKKDTWREDPRGQEIAWLWKRSLPNNKGHVYWTYHPQGKFLNPTEIKGRVICEIASDQAAFLRKP